MGSYNVKVGGDWKPAKEIHVHTSGAWRSAKELWVNVAGTWRKAWVAMTAVVSPETVSGSAFASGGLSTTASANVTAIVTGGSSPTFSWHLTNTGADPASFTSITAQSTQIVVSGGGGTEANGTLWCVVTDGGYSVTTAPIPFSLTINGDLEG